MVWVNLLQQLYSAVFINQLVFNDALKLQKQSVFTAFHKVEPMQKNVDFVDFVLKAYN